jgi:hypothetical protein
MPLHGRTPYALPAAASTVGGGCVLDKTVILKIKKQEM